MQKMLRVEKTTPNADAVRTLLVGAVVAIFILVGLPVVQRSYDILWLDRPLVRATVDIVRGTNEGEVFILYDADAVKPVKATWIASVYSSTNTRISTRRGSGNYHARFDQPKAWSWSAFFDQEDGAPIPTIPTFPFYICVRYVAITLDTGVADDSGQFCSDIFDLDLSE